jgi:hypothetical protein
MLFAYILWESPDRLVGTSGREEDIRKELKSLNVVEILYSCVWKWKMRAVKTIPGMEEKG